MRTHARQLIPLRGVCPHAPGNILTCPCFPDTLLMGYRCIRCQSKRYLVKRSSLQKSISPAIIFILLSLFLGINAARAGWSENVSLTYRGNEISPQVIARNDTVNVVWYQMGSNVANASYIRSTDGGNTWGPIVNLNSSGHLAQYANLNLSERGLIVSWYDYDFAQGISTIAIAKSFNGGTTWSAPSYIYTDNPNHFGNPVSAVKGDSIFIIYRSLRDDSTGLSPFRSIYSYNYGATWSDEVTVGHPYSVEGLPNRMKYCSGTLLFAYSGNPDSAVGGVHVIGYRSTDAGRSWSDTIWISPHTPNWSLEVCLSCNMQIPKLAAAYMDYRYIQYAFHGDIFVTISYDNGFTWPNEYQATNNHTAREPQIDFVADTLITVWSDMRYYNEGKHEIFFNRSNNSGRTWQGEERITNTPDESYDPWVSYDNGKIHVVWTEDVPNSGYETFYKKFTPDSTDAVHEPNISPASDFSLTAYPNPFNSSTVIEYDLAVTSEVSIGIFDIQGRRLETIEQGRQPAGPHSVIWDATGQSSGIYFYRVKAGDKSETRKMVLIK